MFLSSPPSHILLLSEHFFPIEHLEHTFFPNKLLILKVYSSLTKDMPFSLHIKQVVESGILGQVGRLYPTSFLFCPHMLSLSLSRSLACLLTLALAISLSLRHLFGKNR